MENESEALLMMITMITSGWRILTKGRIAYRAFIDDWMNANTAAETDNVFDRARQPPKFPIPVGISTPN